MPTSLELAQPRRYHALVRFKLFRIRKIPSQKQVQVLLSVAGPPISEGIHDLAEKCKRYGTASCPQTNTKTATGTQKIASDGV